MKKFKNKATILSVIALYAFLSFSSILSPASELKAFSLLQNEISVSSSQEIIQQQSDVHDINNQIAEIREKEEDDKDEKHLNFEFTENSAYSLFSLVHQRFKSKLSNSGSDKTSVLPVYILLCTYRL